MEISDLHFPNEGHLAELGVWARVALAYRCVRRSLQCLEAQWPPSVAGLRPVIDRLLKSAELSAANPGGVLPEGLVGERLDDVSEDLAEGASTLSNTSDEVARNVLSALSDFAAAYSAAFFLLTEGDHDGGVELASVRAAQRSIASSIIALHRVHHSREALEAASRDFNVLITLADRARTTASTGVDPQALGPLWPFGPPRGWPEDPSYELRIEVPAGVDDNELRRETAELVRLIDRAQRARGGRGIVVERDIDAFEETRPRQPVTPDGGRP